jgi:hypothetical protein
MSRKHLTKKQQFWAGSNIPKSSGNAFDWQNTAQGIYTKAELGPMEAHVRAKLTLAINPNMPVYSRAKPNKFTNA